MPANYGQMGTPGGVRTSPGKGSIGKPGGPGGKKNPHLENVINAITRPAINDPIKLGAEHPAIPNLDLGEENPHLGITSVFPSKPDWGSQVPTNITPANPLTSDQIAEIIKNLRMKKTKPQHHYMAYDYFNPAPVTQGMYQDPNPVSPADMFSVNPNVAQLSNQSDIDKKAAFEQLNSMMQDKYGDDYRDFRNQLDFKDAYSNPLMGKWTGAMGNYFGSSNPQTVANKINIAPYHPGHEDPMEWADTLIHELTHQGVDKGEVAKKAEADTKVANLQSDIMFIKNQDLSVPDALTEELEAAKAESRLYEIMINEKEQKGLKWSLFGSEENAVRGILDAVRGTSFVNPGFDEVTQVAPTLVQEGPDMDYYTDVLGWGT